MSNKLQTIINSVYSDNDIKYIYDNFNWTPSMIEWRSFKELFTKEFGQNSIVLYQMWKFYETYFHDAYVFSKIVNVVLTKKNKSDPLSSPMSWVNMDFISDKIQKLIEAGLYVIVVNQSDDKHENWQFVHSLERIYTPWMYSSDNKSTNNILSIKEIDWTYHFTFLDILTTECNTFIILKNDEHVILSLLSEYQPKEILLDSNVDIQSISELQRKMPKYENATYIEPVYFNYGNEFEYWVIAYANRLFINKEILSFIKNKVTDYTKNKEQDTITLDINTIENLEILKTNNGDTEHSLFSIINKTSTSTGQRLLKNILLHPLKSVIWIKNRQEMVQELNSLSDSTKTNLYKLLLNIYDIERIITKIWNHTVLPSDFILLESSISAIKSLKEILLANNIINKQLLNHIRSISDFSEVLALIHDIFIDNPNNLIKEWKIFKYGYDKDLDHFIDLTDRKNETLTEYINNEWTVIWMPLTYVENMQGIFINANIRQLWTKEIPKHWYRTRWTKVAERFTTDILNQYHKDSLVAEVSRNKIEYSLFCKLRLESSLYLDELRKASHAIAWIDVLLSFAQLLNNKYTFPEVNDTSNLILLNAAHPVIENITDNYVRNNVYITDKTFKLLTWPNMGGKSVYLKLIWINTLLAQIGSPIPASFWEIGICDNIFVRAGANDNFVKWQSTFYLEMEELSNIIKKATKKSLVILDEIGRWTDTSDWFSIALSSSEYFIENNIRTIFATHYHDLIERITEYKNAGNIYVDVQLLNDNLTFTHKIIEWNPETKNSYGIDIAKMAGIPIEIINRAIKIKNTI